MDIPAIKKLIASGQIKTWADVYGYMTISDMVRLFGRSAKHWKYVKGNPLLMNLEDMFTVVRVLKITREQFYGLVGGGD